MSQLNELRLGFETAYIDGTVASNLAYKPQFVSNNYKEGKKVLSSIEDELLACDQFQISVAFITLGGIEPLLQTLKELEKKGVPGRIMTTDYLCFSDPKALDKLAELSNIELRMYQTDLAGNGFHTKGYIFKENEEYRFIIGSSNMTQSALTRNMEWNTRLVSSDQGEMIGQVKKEYDRLWNAPYTLKYEEFIDNYRVRFEEKKLFEKLVKEQKKIAREDRIPSLQKYMLKPNSMQVAFIHNLKSMLESGVNKALLVSATGDGGIIMTSQAKTA